MIITQPYALFLLLLVPVVWFLPRRIQDVRHGLIRSVVIAITVVALARPVSVIDESATYQVFILDVTESVSADDRRAAESALKQTLDGLDASARVGLIVMGSPSGNLAADRRWESVTRISEARGGSPVGAALETAAGIIPLGSEGAVTLLSDGRATDGRWAIALSELSSRGIPLHTVELQSPQGDVYPADSPPTHRRVKGPAGSLSMNTTLAESLAAEPSALRP